MVLWINSGPSFTGGAGEFNARCRSSSESREENKQGLSKERLGEELKPTGVERNSGCWD